jgi:hypothetical protein
MTTKRLGALDVWALAMDFSPAATDAIPDAPQKAAAPVPAPAPAREEPVIGTLTLDAEQPS